MTPNPLLVAARKQSVRLADILESQIACGWGSVEDGGSSISVFIVVKAISVLGKWS